jgi:hypothetical protein
VRELCLLLWRKFDLNFPCDGRYNLANVNNWGQWDLYGVYVNGP